MKYQLHDSEIDSFILEKDSIILSFPNGFYAEDDNGNEIMPLRHKLVFTIDRTCHDEPLESSVFIRRINRLITVGRIFLLSNLFLFSKKEIWLYMMNTTAN
jgi:hypothetical protein